MKLTPLTICLFVCAILSSCKREVTITVNGRVDSAENTRIRITSEDFKKTFDSTIVKNKRFSMHLKVPEKGFYNIDFTSHEPRPNADGWAHSGLFYVENNGIYEFKANGPESILYNRYDIQSSSFTSNKLNEFSHQSSAIRDSLNAQRRKFLAISDKYMTDPQRLQAYSDSVYSVEDKLRNSNKLTLHKFIKGNTNTIIVPYMMAKMDDLFDEYSFYKNTLDNLSPAVKQSEYYDEASRLLKSVERISKGGHVAELYGKDLNGKGFDNDYKNKKLILINFWASWCIPCRQEIPQLKQIFNNYKDKGFNIISVSIDEDFNLWKNASQQEHIPWTNIAEIVDQTKSKNIENFVVKAVPASYLVDGNGKIISRDIQPDSLRKLLMKRL